MNNVTLIGRLTKHVTLQYTHQGGTPVVNFTVAVRRDFKDKQTGQYETDFIRCVAWGKQAELLSRYVDKGNQLGLQGRLQTRSYQNAQTGQTVYLTEVLVQEVTFLETKQGSQVGNETSD